MDVLIVVSGKGGVGKTTVATALARIITSHGIKVGLIDLDVDSPSIPTITGTTPDDIGIGGALLEPAISNGLKVFSIGHLLPSEDTPILWSGDQKERVLMDIFKSCNFADVEFLVIDLPPGTGDELYGVSNTLQSLSAIVVSLPQQLSIVSVKKALRALKKYEISILGIIENMSGLKCDKCGEIMYPFRHGAGKMLADTNGVAFLGEIPIIMDVSREADEGSVNTIVNSDEFKKIADKIMQKLGLLPEAFVPMPFVIEDELKEKGKKEEGEGKEDKTKEKKKIKGAGVGRITATIKEKKKKKGGGKKSKGKGKKKEKKAVEEKSGGDITEGEKKEEKGESDGEKEVKA